jgi:hypothetical protein
MTQKDMKFRVKDAAHSKAIQEKLFQMGCGWPDPLVKWAHKPYLYANGKIVCYGDTESFFEEDESTEHILTKDGKIVPLVDDDDYTYWEGGGCPVPEGTLVDVKYRDGHIELAIPARVREKETGQKCVACNWSVHDADSCITAYKLSEKQPAVEAPVEAPQETKQEPPTLRPRREMWLDRAAELLAAMSLCVDNGQEIPYEWIVELSQANAYL